MSFIYSRGSKSSGGTSSSSSTSSRYLLASNNFDCKTFFDLSRAKACNSSRVEVVVVVVAAVLTVSSRSFSSNITRTHDVY